MPITLLGDDRLEPSPTSMNFQKTHHDSVDVKLLRLRSSPGKASSLYEATIDGALWLVKVPRKGGDQGETLSVREWVYGRLARELGIPTAPLRLVRITEIACLSSLSPTDADYPKAGQILTATERACIGDQVKWDALTSTHRASVATWSGLTSEGTGDKLRDDGPRDVFSRRGPDAPGYLMVDDESMSSVWEVLLSGASQGRPAATPKSTTVDAVRNYAAGLDPVAAKDLRKRVPACFEEEAWARLTAGAVELPNGYAEALGVGRAKALAVVGAGLGRRAEAILECLSASSNAHA